MCYVDFLTRSPLAQGSLLFVQLSYFSPTEGEIIFKNTNIINCIWAYLDAVRGPNTLILPHPISSLFVFSLYCIHSSRTISFLGTLFCVLWRNCALLDVDKQVSYVHFSLLCGCFYVAFCTSFPPRNGKFSSRFVWIYWDGPWCQNKPYLWGLVICDKKGCK